jgi:hypothetical protein
MENIMRAHNYNFGRPALLTLAAILILGCDNSTAPIKPTLGAILISVWTTSPNSGFDADGYTLHIDGGPPRAVAVSATVTIGALPWGTHLIALDGVASNCTVSDTNTRSVNLVANKSVLAVSFLVTCIGDPNGNGDWDY